MLLLAVSFRVALGMDRVAKLAARESTEEEEEDGKGREDAGGKTSACRELGI